MKSPELDQLRRPHHCLIGIMRHSDISLSRYLWVCESRRSRSYLGYWNRLDLTVRAVSIRRRMPFIGKPCSASFYHRRLSTMRLIVAAKTLMSSTGAALLSGDPDLLKSSSLSNCAIARQHRFWCTPSGARIQVYVRGRHEAAA
jgi:hypothetical protein